MMCVILMMENPKIIYYHQWSQCVVKCQVNSIKDGKEQKVTEQKSQIGSLSSEYHDSFLEMYAFPYHFNPKGKPWRMNVIIWKLSSFSAKINPF